jgi:hypothetical protein
MARMESDLAWFPELGAEERSWVGLVVQAGIRRFVDWYRDGGQSAPEGSEMAASVFGAAPRALAGVITLQQTVDLVRLTIEVVEHNIDDILDPEMAVDVHAAVLRYGREIAFATAEVYARDSTDSSVSPRSTASTTSASSRASQAPRTSAARA